MIRLGYPCDNLTAPRLFRPAQGAPLQHSARPPGTHAFRVSREGGEGLLAASPAPPSWGKKKALS